ncbi:MAG: hypothetical protein AB8B95_09645 [Pseudohongiellaceae bacterium]
MSKMELAKKLAEMTQSMDAARNERNSQVKKIYHRTDPEAWEALKVILNYSEPSLAKRDA